MVPAVRVPWYSTEGFEEKENNNLNAIAIF
jgi:hypothetical protein